ncbi:MAG: class I SAM-dependent methyltransferase [Candidatus Levyibacteriota bacterium]
MNVKGFDDTIKWYDDNAKEYGELTYTESPERLIQKFISMLPRKASVLDAGCGGGRDCGLLLKKGAKVTGLDISKGLLQFAKKKNPDVDFIEGSFLELPFANDTFDGIWARAAILHLEKIEDVRKSLHEFHRVLKKNGILHIYTREQLGKEKTVLVSDRHTKQQRFFRYYQKEELKTYLEEMSFTILELISETDMHGRDGIEWIRVFAKK